MTDKTSKAQDFVIKTHALSKIYGNNQVVDRLNLEIPRGSICGFLGSHGAGKTTTIKMLLGLIKPSGGRGKIFGKDIVKDSWAIRQKIGFLAQSPSFYAHLTARETLRFITSFFDRGSSRVLEAHLEKYLDFVGLSAKADRRVAGLSGGERQRLGIAQAAINEPELIILDEPASTLDPLGRREVLNILENFRGRSTVFYSTHILDDVQRVSDWIVILKQGKLITQGSIAQLLNQKISIFELTVKGDGLAIAQRLKLIPWVVGVTQKVGYPDLVNAPTTKLKIEVTDAIAAEAELLRLVLAIPQVIVTQFGRSISNLEDVFINLMERNNIEP